MATLGTEESGHYKDAAIVEKFKPELKYGLFASQDKKVAIVERWPKVEVPLYAKLQQLQLQHQSQATMLTYCSPKMTRHKLSDNIGSYS